MFESVAPCLPKSAFEVEPFPDPNFPSETEMNQSLEKMVEPISVQVIAPSVAEEEAVVGQAEVENQQTVEESPSSPFLMAEEVVLEEAEIKPEVVDVEVIESVQTFEALEAVKPEPVAVQSEPVALEPEPVVVEPEPVMNQPDPFAAQSEPVVEQEDSFSYPIDKTVVPEVVPDVIAEELEVADIFEEAAEVVPSEEVENPFNLSAPVEAEESREDVAAAFAPAHSAFEPQARTVEVTAQESPSVTSWQPPAPSSKKKNGRFGAFFKQ